VRIKELLKIYRNQKDGSIERLVSALDLLRKIRNKLTHAFIPQVGSDLAKEEGVDQIIAMLKNITTWERLYLQSLRKAHAAVLRGAVRHCLSTHQNPLPPKSGLMLTALKDFTSSHCRNTPPPRRDAQRENASRPPSP